MPEVRKSFEASLRLAPAGEAPDGSFTALVAVFNNRDRQGETIMPGAFAKSVEKFNAGSPLAVLWSHDYLDPLSIIGGVTAMRETAEGLEVSATLDIDINPRARTIYDQMLRGRVREFSVSGHVPDDGWLIVQDGDGLDVLITELELWEVGPCFKGVNPETELRSLKAQDPGGFASRVAAQPTPTPEAATAAIPDALRAALVLASITTI